MSISEKLSGNMDAVAVTMRTASVSCPVSLSRDLRLLTGRLRRRMRSQPRMGALSGAQIAVLSRLEQGASTVSALAAAEGIRPQSMGATVSALESAGLVVRSPDPKDGRQSILSLSERCRVWLSESRIGGEDWLTSAISSRLSPEEQAELARAVGLIKRVVGP